MENYDIFTFRDFYEWDMLADEQLKEAEFYFNATDAMLMEYKKYKVRRGPDFWDHAD